VQKLTLGTVNTQEYDTDPMLDLNKGMIFIPVAYSGRVATLP